MKYACFIFTLVILLILNINTLTAQSSHVYDGVIISKNDVKKKGYIRVTDTTGTPKKVEFSISSTSGFVPYLPTDIKGFEIGKRRFRSAVTKLNPSKGRISSEEYQKSDTLFLEEIISKDFPLFHFKDENKQVHFYILPDKEGEPELLLKDKFMVKDYGFINKSFKRQLLWYFRNQPSLYPKIRTISYHDYSLVSLFKEAIKLKRKNDAVEANRITKTRHTFSLAAGLSVSRVRLQSATAAHIQDKLIFPISYDPTVIFGHEMLFPGTDERISMHNELMFTTYTTEQRVRNGSLSTSTNTFTQHDNSISFSYIRLNNRLRYRFGKETRKRYWYAQFGLSTGIPIVEVNERITAISINGTISSVRTLKVVSETSPLELGVIGGIGLNRGHFFAEVRVSQGGGFSDQGSIRSAVTRFFFITGIKFSNK